MCTAANPYSSPGMYDYQGQFTDDETDAQRG